MAKLIVQHNEDPGIAVILAESGDGYGGVCTECGTQVFQPSLSEAVDVADVHVNHHDGWDVDPS